MSEDSKLPKGNFKPKIKKDNKNGEDFSDSDDSVASFVTASSQSSSNKEVCPICLCSFKNQDSAKPDVCEHKFCLECLEEWSKKTNTCPIDRKVFKAIRVNDSTNRIIKVQDRNQQNPFEAVEDVTYCEVCGRCDREERLLLCDGCDRGFHCECLTPRLNEIPEGTWFCQDCRSLDQRANMRENRPGRFLVIDTEATGATTSINRQLRQAINFIRPFVRTRFSERIRHSVNVSRIERGIYIVVSESETDDDFDTDDDDDDDDEDDDDEEEDENEDETLQFEHGNSKIDEAISSAIERALNTTIIPMARSSTIKKPIKFKRRKRRTKKRRQTTKSSTTSKDGSKPKRKTVRRRKRYKRYRKVTARSSGPSTQERILNSIQKAQQRKFENKTSRDASLTLNSIELEKFAENKREKIRGTCFPKRSQPWFHDSFLNEIDETDPNLPLSSMSLIRSDQHNELNNEQRFDNINRVNTRKQDQTKPSTSSASTDFLSSILNSQKVLLAPSSQIKIQRDGRVGLVEPQKNNIKQAKNNNRLPTRTNSLKVQPIVSNNLKLKRNHTMEDSNVLLTNAPYDPFNPDDDEMDDSVVNDKIEKSLNDNLKPEILDSVENKSKNSVKTENKEPAATNGFSSSENSENKIKEEPNVKKESRSSSDKNNNKSATNKIKEEPKTRERSKSPHVKRRRSRTKSRSKSPKSGRGERRNSTENKKISVSRHSIKREHSRSRSSSSRDDQRHLSKRTSLSNITSSNSSSYHKHHHHNNKSFKKSRSRSKSTDSSDRNRKYSRNDDRTNRKDFDSNKHNDKSLTKNYKSNQQQHFHERSNQLVVDKKLSKDQEKTNEYKQNSDKLDNLKKENSNSLPKIKQSPKYSDLIDEMINEETQQTIDINAIKLPSTKEKINHQKEKTVIDIKQEPNEQTTSVKSNSLDNRLNQLFGSEPGTVKEEKLDHNLSQPSDSNSKISTINETIVKKDTVKEEPYDLELEYQNTVSKETGKTIQAIDDKAPTQKSDSSKTNNIIIKQENSLNQTEQKDLLNNQDKIVNAAKLAIKPFYLAKKISKDDYKIIMKKVVTKALEHNKTGSIIDTNKVNKMVSAYAKKMQIQNKPTNLSKI